MEEFCECHIHIVCVDNNRLGQTGDRLGLGAGTGRAARHQGVGPVVGIALEDWDGLADSIVAFVDIAHDAGPATGQGAFLAGLMTAVVEVPGVTAGSLPMVTFLGDPGSRYWISERGEGYFAVSLALPAPTELTFTWSVAR